MTDITIIEGHLKTGPRKCQSFKYTWAAFLGLSEDGTAGFLVRRCGTTLAGCGWFPWDWRCLLLAMHLHLTSLFLFLLVVLMEQVGMSRCNPKNSQALGSGLDTFRHLRMWLQ